MPFLSISGNSLINYDLLRWIVFNAMLQPSADYLGWLLTRFIPILEMTVNSTFPDRTPEVQDILGNRLGQGRADSVQSDYIRL
jgi:hypothetical protein